MRSLLRGILYGESSGLSNYRLYIGLGNISLIRLTFSSPPPHTLPSTFVLNGIITIDQMNITTYRLQILRKGKASLKGLSHEIDFKNFDKNLQNLAYLRDAAGF